MRLRIELDTNTKADENNSSGSRYHFIGFEQIENGNTNEEEMHEMSEMAIRFMLSIIKMDGPEERSEDDIKGFTARRLLPALGLTITKPYNQKPK